MQWLVDKIPLPAAGVKNSNIAKREKQFRRFTHLLGTVHTPVLGTKTSQNLSRLSLERDCSPKRVKKTPVIQILLLPESATLVWQHLSVQS